MKIGKRAIDENSTTYKEALVAFCNGTHATELAHLFPQVKLETMRRYFRRSLGDEAYTNITKHGRTIKNYDVFDLSLIIPKPGRDKPEPSREYLTHYNAWMDTVSIATPVWAYGGLPEED